LREKSDYYDDALVFFESRISQKKQLIDLYLGLGSDVVRSELLMALEKDFKSLVLDCERFKSSKDTLSQNVECLSAMRNPPASNTGGIDAKSSPFLDFLLIEQDKKLVRIPRPDSTKSPNVAFIDWLTFTFKISNFYEQFPNVQAISNDGQDCVFAISAALNAALGYGVTDKRKTGMNFYKDSYTLGNGWGFLAIGGQKETVCITINGQGLLAARSDWQTRIKKLGERIKANITRVDLAADFFFGEYTVDKADQDDTNGLFSMGARAPKVEHLGNWKRPDGSGRTLQVGSRQSGKLCRTYEKGLQLGGIFSGLYKDWNRVEVELHNQDRVLPWDMLEKPGQYLAGAYPAFAFVNQDQERIKTKKNIVKATVQKAKEVIKKQFGRYLWAFSELGGIESLSDLFIPELPSRLVVPHYSTSAPMMGFERISEDLALDLAFS
jgi:phage replication initiation protein